MNDGCGASVVRGVRPSSRRRPVEAEARLSSARSGGRSGWGAAAGCGRSDARRRGSRRDRPMCRDIRGRDESNRAGLEHARPFAVDREQALVLDFRGFEQMVDEVRRLYWDQRHECDDDEQTHASIPWTQTQGCTAYHSSHTYTEDASKTPSFFRTSRTRTPLSCAQARPRASFRTSVDRVCPRDRIARVPRDEGSMGCGDVSESS